MCLTESPGSFCVKKCVILFKIEKGKLELMLGGSAVLLVGKLKLSFFFFFFF